MPGRSAAKSRYRWVASISWSSGEPSAGRRRRVLRSVRPGATGAGAQSEIGETFLLEQFDPGLDEPLRQRRTDHGDIVYQTWHLCGPAGQQGIGVGEAAGPGRCGVTVLRPPERFGVLLENLELQAGLRDGGDDLAERPLPFTGAVAREGVIDRGLREVAAIRADARLVRIPGPQRDGRVGLVHEKVPTRAQHARHIPCPGVDVTHPQHCALAGVHEIRSLVPNRYAGNLSHDVLAAETQLAR